MNDVVGFVLLCVGVVTLCHFVDKQGLEGFVMLAGAFLVGLLIGRRERQ